MAAGPLQPGDPPAIGPYRLAGRLGSGGQGVVYLAESPAGPVAVKRLHAHMSTDPRTRSVFERELRAAQRVDPFCTARIVDVDVDVDGGQPYFVSEYVEGPSLREAVETDGPRSGAALHRLAIGTATALVAIHKAGIIHRDVKPSNVILAPDGPRVIDFGIARLLDVTASVSSGVVGTPAYMAPEQLSEGALTTSVDVFAWASTIVYAATAHAPFGETSIPVIINRILNHEPDLGALEGPLRTLTERAFAKNPEARPTAQELLLGLLGGVSAPAAGGERSGGPRERAARPTSTGLSQEARPVTSTGSSVGGWPGPATATSPPSAGPPSAGSVATVGGDVRSHRRSRLIGLAAAAGAAAVVVALSVAWLVPHGTAPEARESATGPTPRKGTASSSARPSIPAVAAKAMRPSPGPLPGTKARLSADPGGRLALVAYGDYRLNPRTGRFEVDPKTRWMANSPDGWLGAEIGDDDKKALTIHDWRSDSWRVIRLPAPADGPVAWSPDGRKLLMTVPGEEVYHNRGFIVVDTATWRPKLLSIPGRTPDRFWWNHTSDGVVASSGSTFRYAVRFYDLDGRLVRELKGPFKGLVDGPVSPSGGYLVTRCTNDDNARDRLDDCVWDARSGERRGGLYVGLGGLLGWYDDDHLAVCYETDYNDATGDRPEGDTFVKDLKGRTTATLVDYVGGGDDVPFFQYAPYPA
ncbi:protein kinase [Microbispora cellulosiformans]|uniref:non-specific serine/threonine protein kinase n=1 Tax=Microbispora cellulosiformans TaxID=2614688 RepID=A0A5J5JUW7_9ACTN|nr:WD40 repeat domain-containing serine/threonine protein kinase [Microbispora cellulosiformans]KAA9374556.1 protein kinase [Microbispora cellulosiformans]